MVRYFICVFYIASAAFYCRASPLRSGGHQDDRELGDELTLFKQLLRKEIQEDARNVENPYNTLDAAYRDVNDEDVEVPDINLRPKRTQNVNATDFLERFGYLPVMKEGVQHDQAARTGALRRFQKMYHIKQTGQLDEMTMKMMAAPRCGMPDQIPEEYVEESMSRTSAETLKQDLKANNFYVPGYKWPKLDLTWHLKNFWSNPNLPQETQKTALRRAFKFWSDASGLTFKETSGTGDLNLEFVRRSHEDGVQNSFDGPGGVLAHAFYPQSGETHFDDDEEWTDGKNSGINLMIVATHELGHAMGLGHSEVQGSLMAPFYQGFIPNFQLPYDDTIAIQSLYGGNGSPNKPEAATTTSTTTTTTTKKPKVTTKATTKAPTPGLPDSCTVVYKAVTQTHDHRIYVFNGQWMWRMSEYGLDTGFPVAIKAYYESAPENIDAVIFSWKTYYTYMFKGNNIWRYYGFQLVDSKTVTTSGYPSSPRAALVGTDGTICLYKDGYCWTFDEESIDITTDAPKNFQEVIPGSPSSFDSVVRIAEDPNVYFFKGNDYYKYDIASQTILPGYPKPKQGPWMGPACGAKPYTPK